MAYSGVSVDAWNVESEFDHSSDQTRPEIKKDKNLNIVYLAPSFIPSKSANSVQVMKMCQAFARIGHVVELVTFDGTPEYGGFSDDRVFDFYGIEPVFRLNRIRIPAVTGAETMMAARLIPFLSRIPRENTLVYARLLYGAVEAAFLGFRTIYEAHELPMGAQRTWLERWLFQNRNVLKLVVISEALRHLYRVRVLKRIRNRIKIQVAHDGADIPVFDRYHRRNHEITRGKRASLNLGYVGHLHKGRGIDVLLALATRTPDCDYHILGGNLAHVEQWRRRSPQNVIFYGYAEPSRVKYFVREMDVLLLPYQRQVFIDSKKRDTGLWMSPMKMFEYMASGKPIISSDLPVLREVLTDRKNSLLVKADSVQEWVEAVNEMRSSSLRKRLAREAFWDLSVHHTWDTRAREIFRDL